MADPAPYNDGDTSDDSGAGAGRGDTTGTPRWVTVFGIILAVVVLLFVIVLLLGGGPLGSHGPGRHSPSRDSSGHAPSPGITAAQAPAVAGGASSLQGGAG